MSYIDIFNQRNAAYGSTLRDENINDTKRAIAASIKHSPSYYPITIDSSSIVYDSQIVDDSQTRDEKILSTYYETPISWGSVIAWKSPTDKWIVVSFDEMSEIYKRCKIRKCLGTLKWLDDDGYQKSSPFAYRVDPVSTFGVQNGSIIDLDNERRQIIVPSNADTKKFNKKKRFVLDERAWEVIGTDKLTMGLVHVTLIGTEVSAADRVDLGLADYVGNIANYTIRITDGESFSLRANQTLQLAAEVKNNGQIVNKPIIWSVSDTSIATINSSGLLVPIANGNLIVTVKLASDLTILDNANVTVEFATIDNYSIELDSSLDVLTNTSKTFTAIVKNNLVVDPTRTVQWSIKADDGVSPPTAATMIFNSTTQFTLKSNKVGWVKVTAILIGSSPTLSQTFRIKVESLV